MAFNLWLTFLASCFILSVIPGPSVLVVTSQSIANGWRAALVCIAGELLGGVCLMAASLLGVGAVVAASPLAFLALKWVGVGFLLTLGAKALRTARRPASRQPQQAPIRGSFNAGFWTSLLNPKSLVFYLAFFTQFIDTARPLPIQYAILMSTAVAMAGMVLGTYALMATKLRPHISSSAAQRKVSGVSGALYIAGGAMVAALR